MSPYRPSIPVRSVDASKVHEASHPFQRRLTGKEEEDLFYQPSIKNNNQSNPISSQLKHKQPTPLEAALPTIVIAASPVVLPDDAPEAGPTLPKLPAALPTIIEPFLLFARTHLYLYSLSI
jgi:hypothetical protein